MIGSVALKAAETVEHSLGPAVALRSYKALFGQNDPEVVAAAVRGALRCALELRDDDEVTLVAARWAELRRVVTTDEVVGHCRRLLREGRGRPARVIADAEVMRSDSARAWYLAARVRDAVGDAEAAAAAFERAAGGEGEVAKQAKAALLERSLRSGAAVDDVEAEGSDAQRLLVAAGKLRSSSKFKRAAGLSLLADLAEGPLATEAIALAAAQADGQRALSWVEAERVEAVLKHWPDEAQRDVALRRVRRRRAIAAAEDDEARRAAVREALSDEPGGLRHLELVEAVVAGQELDPDVVAVAAGVPPAAAAALAAVHAMRRGAPEEAVRPMALLLDDPRGSGWVVARLAFEQPKLRERAAGLVEALLDAPSAGAPPTWFPLALAAGEHPIAEELLRRGARAGEEACTSALATRLAACGWAAHEAGDDDAALACLREARELARGAT